MSSEVQIFENGGFGKVRVILQNDEYLFVAKDVVEALELTWNGSRLSHVPNEWKGMTSVVTPGGKQEMATLSEQGLYFFLGRSDSSKALPFQKWLAGEVLPSIRKTGSYSLEKKHVPSSELANLLEGAKVIFSSAGIVGNQQTLALDKLYHRHAGYSALDTAQIKLVAPETAQMLTPTEIGKHFVRPNDGKFYSGLQVNKLLQEHGLQKSVSGKWEPTNKGMEYEPVMLDTGKAHSNGIPVRQLKWSSKILDFCARFWTKAA